MAKIFGGRLILYPSLTTSLIVDIERSRGGQWGAATLALYVLGHTLLCLIQEWITNPKEHKVLTSQE